VEFKGLNQDGQKTLKIEDELLFSFTPEKLEEYIGGREFILGSSALLSISSKYYLSLDLNLATSKAQNYYGKIVTGQPIKLFFLKREPVFLDIVHSDIPSIDKIKGETKYSMMAVVDKTDLKAIRKCELDKIGIVWSSGYEEYPIYDVDIFKNQYKCLKANK